MGAELFHPDGRTDRRADLLSANFSKAPKIIVAVFFSSLLLRCAKEHSVSWGLQGFASLAFW